ncbi:L-methionine/branched-chain amino acid transporter [Thaumasiovibrio subtropicus]|uniref:L-methionine/branched-chain amino acid transporter n=1 Tax=Thaumasiovibrio subtropicus TaxID=1891207 RepID=UPI000B35FD11|nr:L-methionine/branched-chain amino acid transporter [Thaumasiovibrio subtropicus]
MSQLKKEITLLSGVGQLSTTLLGTGLFMIPALAATVAGEDVLWAWLLLLIAICPIALTFAALGKRYPNAGGTAHFVNIGFNDKLANAVGWLFLSCIPVGVPAAIALAASFLTPWLPTQIQYPFVAECLTVALLVVVNLAGSKTSSRLQTVIAIGLLTLIALFFWRGDVTHIDIQMPAIQTVDWAAIGAALAVMFWCFVGIEAFAHMGEEFKNPQRDFPIAIILGCIVAGLTYWACTVVVLKFSAYGTPEMDTGALPWITAMLFGQSSKLLVSLLGFLACFASVNLYMQSLSRMLWSQAKQTRTNSRLTQIDPRGVPRNATYAVTAVIMLSLLIGHGIGVDIHMFVKLANGVFVLIYLLAMLAAVKLLSGATKALAYLALVLCMIVFACLGWASLYALGVFGLLLFNPKGRLNQKLAS